MSMNPIKMRTENFVYLKFIQVDSPIQRLNSDFNLIHSFFLLVRYFSFIFVIASCVRRRFWLSLSGFFVTFCVCFIWD